METVLVAGANGLTGREIIAILKESTIYTPLAMIRKEEQKEYFEKMGVKTIVADLEGDLQYAVKAADRIIFAAGSGGHTPPQKTIDVDQNGAISLIKTAEAAGISKFVMLSSLGTDTPLKGQEKIQHYLEAKKIADDYLKGSSLRYTIVRPGYLTNKDSTGKIKAQAEGLERGEISRKDVAQVLVDALADNIAPDQAVEIIAGETKIPEALKGI
ncbi:MAG TPA: SDR family oxidoreductase [Sphingobacterium sp.]|nr:SDR family oxidoreductase [Sphingobacterium sp.]